MEEIAKDVNHFYIENVLAIQRGEKVIKVVQFIYGLTMGGAETLVKDYALGINKKIFDLTVLCYKHADSPYEKMLEENGVKVVYIEDKIPFFKKQNICIKYYIWRIDPAIIHFHLTLSSYIKFAKPKKDTVIFLTQHFQVRRWLISYPKDISAAKWLKNHYRMRIIALNESMRKEINELFNVDDTVILNNGIHLQRFIDAVPRDITKSILKIPKESFVVGHIGRFCEIKNHDFLIDIFSALAKKREDAFLLLVGKGETQEKIYNKLLNLGLKDKFCILSNRTDIPDLLKVMDVMIFPSFSEGMPITLVEAQVSGVKCLVADTISKEIMISNLIKFESLNRSAEEWAEKIVNWKQEEVIYSDIDRWDINKIIKKLEQLYIKEINDYKQDMNKE